MEDTTVCVIGAGVVGASVALALARRGVGVMLLEAEREPGLAASGTNSGILHTGFDSPPGTLETRLIYRSVELRDPLLEAFGVPLLRCGAIVRPNGPKEEAALGELAERAAANGVEVERRGATLRVPGESVTDPVAMTLAIARGAEDLGADLRCAARVTSVRGLEGGLEVATAGRMRVQCRVAVNCAGLHADDVARAAGDGHIRIVPRKGEFVVFRPGPQATPIEQIVLPVPSDRTKGVLVFPTTDGNVIAGPTARDQTDKGDWRVSPEAQSELVEQALRRAPELADYELIASYAGLRPAGDGVNYVIERSQACPRLVHAAAIRSTGLSACFGIAEHVAGLVEEAGVELGPERAIEPAATARPSGPWWRRSAAYWNRTDGGNY